MLSGIELSDAMTERLRVEAGAERIDVVIGDMAGDVAYDHDVDFVVRQAV